MVKISAQFTHEVGKRLDVLSDGDDEIFFLCCICESFLG